jgi:hypothetical protein
MRLFITLLASICLSYTLQAAEPLKTISLKDGRSWKGARFAGVKGDFAVIEVVGLGPVDVRLADLNEPEFSAAQKIWQERAAATADAKAKTKAAWAKGTLVVPTTAGPIELVRGWEVESSGLVVKFHIVGGEKRVALKDLSSEWQARVKQPFDSVK